MLHSHLKGYLNKQNSVCAGECETLKVFISNFCHSLTILSGSLIFNLVRRNRSSLLFWKWKRLNSNREWRATSLYYWKLFKVRTVCFVLDQHVVTTRSHHMAYSEDYNGINVRSHSTTSYLKEWWYSFAYTVMWAKKPKWECYKKCAQKGSHWRA